MDRLSMQKGDDPLVKKCNWKYVDYINFVLARKGIKEISLFTAMQKLSLEEHQNHAGGSNER